MFKNYLKIAFRNLLKYKGYSFINITGLAIGLSAFFLILIFVRFELSYDQSFEKSNRIFRLYSEIKTSNGLQRTAQSPSGWSRYFMSDFPEVEQVSRYKPPNQWWKVVHESNVFYEKNWAFADSSFVPLFDVKVVKSENNQWLSKPYQVLVSQSMAEKYFKEQNPIGQSFKLDNQYEFFVSGVFEDLPQNIHFRTDFIASFVTLQDSIYGANFLEVDNFPNVYTYIELNDPSKKLAFEAKLPQLIRQYVGDPQQLEEAGFEVKAALQPLTSIHLDSHLENEITANGNRTTILIFIAIALFVIVIAGINFLNLSTARSLKRAKEVGLRKAIGAQKRQLIYQFLGESLFITFIAMLVAMLIVVAVLPEFSSLTQQNFTLSSAFGISNLIILFLASITIGLLSGIYPAFYLSAFNATEVLKGGRLVSGKQSALFRKALIVFQFMLSIAIIICTSVLYQQLNFIQKLDLGMDKEKVMVVQLTDPVLRAKYKVFKDRLKRLPIVEGVSASFSAPADVINQGFFRPDHASVEEKWMTCFFGADFDFFNTLGMEIIAGKPFLTEHPSDTLNGVVINEAAVEQFGYDSPEAAIGEELYADGNNNAQPLKVIGVVRDFHMQSVHDKIPPTLIMHWNVQAYFFSFIRVSGEYRTAVEQVDNIWKEVMVNYPFQYAFLDDNFEMLYTTEYVLKDLLTYFAVLTIIIACLGLYGLASFSVQQRKKEVGVRKVLGASVNRLIVLLTTEYTLLVVFAFILAAPIAYYSMKLWLNSFQFRVGFGILDFALPFAVALLLSVLTVGYQALKVAISNPVESIGSN